MSKTGIIYKATGPTGKVYIGKTFECLDKRKTQHLSNAFNSKYTAYNTKFYKAIRKYGKSVFVWSIIEGGVLNEDELDILERKYIKEFNSFKLGYNSTLGGEGILGLKHKNSVKKKISVLSSARNKGSGNPRYGATVTKETRDKISKSNSGKIRSEEHKQKLSKSLKGRIISDETRIKMVNSAGGNYIEVCVNDKIIHTFISQRECVKYLNLNRVRLRKRLKDGKIYRGYVFRYRKI